MTSINIIDSICQIELISIFLLICQMHEGGGSEWMKTRSYMLMLNTLRTCSESLSDVFNIFENLDISAQTYSQLLKV